MQQPSCGLFGTAENGTCVCDPGWSQSLDFVFFLPKNASDDEEVLATLPCDAQTTLLQVLYGLSGVCSLLIIVTYMVVIKKVSQFKRLLPLFLGFLLHAIHSFYKVLNFDINGSFSVDMFFSLTFIVAFTVTNISTLVFLNKYVWYQEHIMPVHRKATMVSIKHVAHSQYLAVFMTLLASGLVTTALFVEETPRRDILFRSGLVLYSVFSVFVLLPGAYLLNLLIIDVKKTAAVGTTRLDVGNAIKNLKRVKIATIALHVLIISGFFLAIVSTIGIIVIKYMIPLCLVVGCFHALVVLYSLQDTRARRRRQRKIQNQKTSNSGGTHKGSMNAKGPRLLEDFDDIGLQEIDSIAKADVIRKRSENKLSRVHETSIHRHSTSL